MHGLPGFIGSEGVGDFLERSRRVAVFTRTTVDEQYFHFVPFWHFYLTQRISELTPFRGEDEIINTFLFMV
jgi:hypothetical protein